MQARHYDALVKIELSLRRARDEIASGASPDLVAFELQTAARETHLLLGKAFDEQVIDRIFKEFCLGK